MNASTDKAPGDLTRNQRLVLDVLVKADSPMSAYDILDALRKDGLRAPPQVYRALDKLQSCALVHRIECLNAFVACNQTHEHGPQAIVMVICEHCSKVFEISDAALGRRLGQLAHEQHFATSGTTIELRGCCSHCQ